MRLLKNKGLLGISIVVLCVFGFIWLKYLPGGAHDGALNASLNKGQKRTAHGTHKGNSATPLNSGNPAMLIEEKNLGTASNTSQKIAAIEKYQTSETDLSRNGAAKESKDAEETLKDWNVKLESYCGEPALDKVVTHEDQIATVELFNKLDSNQQLEQIQQAMNVLPDSTVQVVYGILFDNTQAEEIVNVIFSDLLNRNDAIKYPVMEEILKDKNHKMYVESARILDVTGLLPKED
jgi:hypothetical protein